MMSGQEKPPPGLRLTREDTSTLKSIVEGNQLQEDLGGGVYWHRFTVIGGASLNKEETLKLIIAHVHPALLVPVNYQIHGKDSYFLAGKGCRDAIIMLCKHELMFAHPGLQRKLKLEIDLNYKEESAYGVDIPTKVAAVNASRLKITQGLQVLDLTEYHKDPVLVSAGIFLPLFVPVNVSFVLHEAAYNPHLSNIKTLILAHNDIHTLEGLLPESAKVVPKPLIKELDLRHNKVDWEGLSQISPLLKVSKIWLDDNPICNDFLNQREYITAIKSIIPTLTHLDGVNVEADKSSLAKGLQPAPVWAVSTEAKSFGEQFVSHLLLHPPPLPPATLWPTIYSPNALFSLVLHQPPNTPTPDSFPQSTLIPLKALDRNILKVSDYNKLYPLLKQGPEEISEALASLPEIKFAPSTLTVDVPYYMPEQSGLVVVSGLAWTGSEGILSAGGAMSSYFRSTRMFLVERSNRLGEWKITNDMWALAPAEPPNVIEMLSLFKSDEDELVVRGKQGEEELVASFKHLTSMDTIWCKKFLEDAGWNLETALQAFTDKYKIHQIPSEAFLD